MGGSGLARAAGSAGHQAHPAGDPQLEDFVAELGKVAAAAQAGDELGLRFAAADLARLCPSVLLPANPPVTVAGRREALEAALGLPVAPVGYRADMTVCLGLEPCPAAKVVAAAHRLVAGTVEAIRPYAGELAAVGPDFAAALADGRLDRYLVSWPERSQTATVPARRSRSA